MYYIIILYGHVRAIPIYQLYDTQHNRCQHLGYHIKQSRKALEGIQWGCYVEEAWEEHYNFVHLPPAETAA